MIENIRLKTTTRFLSISFRFVTSHEFLQVHLDLNKDKLLGPSNLPSWALKLGAPELAKPLCFLFNEYLKADKISFATKICSQQSST